MLIDKTLLELVHSVDNSDVISVQPLKPERSDLVVSCASGQRYLLRFEEQLVSLLRQKWGYEQLRAGGIACPQVEAFLEPDDDHPSGCLLLSWVDATPAGDVIDRLGPGPASYALCRELGRALRGLHGVTTLPPVPDYIFRHTREGAEESSRACFKSLCDDGLIDDTFLRQANRLVEKHLALVPDPMPYSLCFSDMHFRNVLVAGDEEPTVAAFVDIEEIGVGWPMWDFTNWECWGLRFGLGWARPHILEGYGSLDMDAYKLALLIRLSRPLTFVGSTREQIVAAVEQQDLAQFDLGELYRGGT